MSKYRNWKMTSKESLKNFFEKSIKQNGCVRILTVLDHVSQSGMTRYISAFIPLVVDGKAQNICIAREYRVGGCGMDMGFHLAYTLFHSVYEYGQEGREYQSYLCHEWL